MLAQLRSYTLLGIDALPVEVEVDAAPGMPKTILVGLPELAVRESVHRIERALANLRFSLPTGRTIINLAPADLRKDAGAFDLPIALGMLAGTGQLRVRPGELAEWAIVGELALDVRAHDRVLGEPADHRRGLAHAVEHRERALVDRHHPRPGGPQVEGGKRGH